MLVIESNLELEGTSREILRPRHGKTERVHARMRPRESAIMIYINDAPEIEVTGRMSMTRRVAQLDSY